MNIFLGIIISFLSIIDEKLFLVIYAIYVIFVIVIIAKKLKNNNENRRDDYRNEFLIENSWMYFLGVSSIATNRSEIYIDD